MRRLLFIALLLLFPTALCAQTQNQLDTDSFGGSNGDNLDTYNAKWSSPDPTGFNQVKIQGTPGIGGVFAAEMNTGATWTNDHYGEIKVDGTTVAAVIGVCVRVVASGAPAHMNGYCGGRHTNVLGTGMWIWRMDAGSVAANSGQLTATDITTNDVINLEAVGTTIRLRVNGSVIGSWVETTYQTGGNPGLLIDGAGSTRHGGTWKAGSVITATSRALTLLGVGK